MRRRVHTKRTQMGCHWKERKGQKLHRMKSRGRWTTAGSARTADSPSICMGGGRFNWNERHRSGSQDLGLYIHFRCPNPVTLPGHIDDAFFSHFRRTCLGVRRHRPAQQHRSWALNAFLDATVPMIVNYIRPRAAKPIPSWIKP